MIIHIIRPNETIEDIAEKYNLTIDEVKRANAHFRSWDNLAPGARISLPEIPQHVIDEIDSVEPFIEDYYTTIDIDNLKKIKTEEVNLVINELISDKRKEQTAKVLADAIVEYLKTIK